MTGNPRHGANILDDPGGLPFARQPSLPFAENHASPELPPSDARVSAVLGDQQSGVDRLIDATGLPSQVVSATMMKLKMYRLARALPGFRLVNQ